MSEEQTGETKEFNKLRKAPVVIGALIATVYGLLFLKYRQPQLFGMEPVSSLNTNHAVIDEDIQVYQAFLAQANTDHELEQAFSKSGPGPSRISRADLNRKKIMLAGENYNTTVFRLVSDTVTSNKIGPLSKYLHYTQWSTARPRQIRFSARITHGPQQHQCTNPAVHISTSCDLQSCKLPQKLHEDRRHV